MVGLLLQQNSTDIDGRPAVGADLGRLMMGLLLEYISTDTDSRPTVDL